MDNDDEPCGRCAHFLGGHWMLAFGDSPMQGGIMLCSDGDCQCYGTWGVGANSAVPTDVPDFAEAMQIRARLVAER